MIVNPANGGQNITINPAQPNYPTDRASRLAHARHDQRAAAAARSTRSPARTATYNNSEC